jgi:protocatechuate 3,4-dioxygenase beta subunit
MRSHDPQLSRRSFLLGGAAIITRPRILTPACSLVPEQEEGPYYIDFEKVRQDLTENKPGIPLQLRIALVDAKQCQPLENAAVDIWHCDALGVYSGFTANGGGERTGGQRALGPLGRPPVGFGPFGPRGRGGVRGGNTGDETRFLRGVQLTDKQGFADFSTIYPGWYAGRTIHIHLKVHLGGGIAGEQYGGGHVSHTGQLFFPEDLTEQVAKMDPYAKHSNVHRTLNNEDHIFLDQGGGRSMVKIERLQKGANEGGFLATITLGVDPGATPRVF